MGFIPVPRSSQYILQPLSDSTEWIFWQQKAIKAFFQERYTKSKKMNSLDINLIKKLWWKFENKEKVHSTKKQLSNVIQEILNHSE